MKSILAIFTFVSTASAGGLIPIVSHVDIRCHYEPGGWNIGLVTSEWTFDPTGSPDGIFAPDAAFLSLSDKPIIAGNASISGARSTQPANSAFAFTGAQPGEPIWLAVQGTPGAGEAWPGFANDQPAGTFGSYLPNDPRVPQVNARPYLRISLVDYHPPHGKTSHFSMWSSTTGQPPTVWMSTFNPPVENSYYFAEGTHTHVQWGFTQTGIHRVTLQASAFLGPGATNPTGPSEPFTLIFAVGTVGRWQAESFNAAQLADPAISALDADPDGDGVANSLEYAFGTHPLSGSTSLVEVGLSGPEFSLVNDGGTLYQTVTFPRRRAGQRLTPDLYQPVFSDNLSGGWTTQGMVVQSADFPSPHQALNARWERVTARRPVPPGANKGFARVGLIPGDGFSTP